MGIGQLWRTIRNNGGIWKSLKALYIRDDLKEGTLVGEDKYGNKYYENNRYFLGRNRWVNYSPHVGLNYDGSQVPAEWFGWLHYRTDLPPHEEPFRPKYHWMAPHEENVSGTRDQYVPYSTTRPKITPWKPGQSSSEHGEPTKAKRPPKCVKKKKKREEPTKDHEDESEERETPPKCGEVELRKGREDEDEKKERPTCEKPITAFH